MKTLLKSLKITLAFCVLFTVGYILVLWLFAQVAAPGKGGNAATLELDGRTVGGANVGQLFTDSTHFWGRPSMAGYDAGSSAGSNKGPTNEAYLQEVDRRTEAFLQAHPYLKREEVPAEMVTASASGLDPHISPASAYVQVGRVAKACGMSEESVRELVDNAVEEPFLGLFGTAKVNVLKLNIALEEAQQ